MTDLARTARSRSTAAASTGATGATEPEPYPVDLAGGAGRRVLISQEAGGTLRYVVLDAAGNEVVSESRLHQPLVVDVDASDVWAREADATAIEVSRISRDLLRNTTTDSQVTARRMASAFTAFKAMLWATFGVGVAAFVAALVKGWGAGGSAGDQVATIVFGGLSATAFVAAFISRPATTMGEAGLRAAWAQTIVTTYWSKLAYMSDPTNVLDQLERAQREVNASMREYFMVAAPAGQQGTDAGAGAAAVDTAATGSGAADHLAS